MPKAKDLTGKKFDRLIAIRPTTKRESGGVVWLCKCDCGEYCERSSKVLQRAGHHSCGCYNKEQITNLNKKNLIGKHFGKLTVIKETDKRDSGGNIIWLCQCECGNTCEIRTGSLTSGNTTSCGCVNYSIGEKNIEKILKTNNISFISQYTEPSLKLKKFDFAICDIEKIVRLIEFDGEQHYIDRKGVWNSVETLEDIQKRDKIKNEWAAAHNIPLVRIPYWERDNITLEMLLGDKYLVG